MSVDPLDLLATPSPAVPEPVVLELLAREYGLAGELTPLISERDQNFRLETADGRVLVVKIANAAEPEQITDFQIQALIHLQDSGCPVSVPQIVRTNDGAVATTIRSDVSSHVLRLVSYIEGQPVEGTVAGPELAFALGQSLAQLDVALSNFEHPGQSQVLLWDMQRASELRPLMQHVVEPDLQDLVRTCLYDFEQAAKPAFDTLRSQVIHNDLNPGNVVVDDTQPPGVAGVIDFGDMIHAPLIVDVAIAASYLRSTDDDLQSTRMLLAGYEVVTPLEDVERSLLYDLVRMRLATTITILHWRESARSSADPYLQKALQERSSEKFLRHITPLGRGGFSSRVFAPKN